MPDLVGNSGNPGKILVRGFIAYFWAKFRILFALQPLAVRPQWLKSVLSYGTSTVICNA